LGGEELGDFCTPRPEEWEWNVKATQTEDARIVRVREWNRYVRGIPAACKHEEEVDVNAAEEIGAELHQVWRVNSRPDVKSMGRSTQTHSTTRYRTMLWWRRGFLSVATKTL